MIKSVSYDQIEIIQGILKLHCSGPIELDATYGRGNFYKTEISEPKYKFDLFPHNSKIDQADARKLPIKNNSIKTIMFDPPFLATKGKSLKIVDESNKINKRFGVYPTEKELFKFYALALKEFYRILEEGGILIFKCQDKVSSGKQYLSHVFIINEAEKLGYYCKDLFVLLSKHRIVADWQLRNQKNARKFHSYFLVLEKSDRKIKYL
jgi:SAM-dependent methyltransferase